MDKEDQIKSVLKRDLGVGERVTEQKINDVTKNLAESVDWSDGKDTRLPGKTEKSVDWGDGKDQ